MSDEELARGERNRPWQRWSPHVSCHGSFLSLPSWRAGSRPSHLCHRDAHQDVPSRGRAQGTSARPTRARSQTETSISREREGVWGWVKRESEKAEQERLARLRRQEQEDLELAIALSKADMPAT